MASVYWIRQLLPVTGEWFCVTNEEDDRWFIERVVAWALVHAEQSTDHVRAIDSRGMPHEDCDGEAHYVLGSDVSPIGLTWGEIYQRTQPSRVLCREITDLVRGNM